MSKLRFSKEYDLLLSRLIEARKSSGITQKQVAAKLGKPQSHVSKCESRDREINIIDLWKWSNALGIRLSDLIQQFETDVENSGSKRGRRMRRPPVVEPPDSDSD